MELPEGPVVRTWCFHCRGPGSSPGQGTKISQAVCVAWWKKLKKRKKSNNTYIYTCIHIHKFTCTCTNMHI